MGKTMQKVAALALMLYKEEYQASLLNEALQVDIGKDFIFDLQDWLEKYKQEIDAKNESFLKQRK